MRARLLARVRREKPGAGIGPTGLSVVMQYKFPLTPPETIPIGAKRRIRADVGREKADEELTKKNQDIGRGEYDRLRIRSTFLAGLRSNGSSYRSFLDARYTLSGLPLVRALTPPAENDHQAEASGIWVDHAANEVALTCCS